jgi:hypothetical protein
MGNRADMRVDPTTSTPKQKLAKSEKLNQEKKQNGGAREGAGRNPFEPTDKDREMVEKLANWGVAEHHISPLIGDGISVMTLRKYFMTELERGRAKASAGIGQTLFQKAMAGDVASLIWWTKTQMRWTEAPRQIEVSGNISITDALAQAQSRLIEAEIVEMDTPLLGVTDAVTVDVTPVTVEYVGGNNGGNITDRGEENAMKSRG